jgi:hypothetical protein
MHVCSSWQMANGKWQMANGKWQMANGKWQMANGKNGKVREKAGMKGCPEIPAVFLGLADGRTVTPVRRLAPPMYGRNLRIAGKSRANSPIAR